jgi:hypothetical protein
MHLAMSLPYENFQPEITFKLYNLSDKCVIHEFAYLQELEPSKHCEISGWKLKNGNTSKQNELFLHITESFYQAIYEAKYWIKLKIFKTA